MYRYVKKAFDIVTAFSILVLLFPLFVILSVAIKIDDNDSVFFKPERPGKSGNEFSDIERMTKVGKFIRRFSLDEIPQFIYVLIVEMSIIDFRFCLKEYLPLYIKRQMCRHEANGRNAVDQFIVGEEVNRSYDITVEKYKCKSKTEEVIR